jgi:transcriptional regulator with XRE-family HTH domain
MARFAFIKLIVFRFVVRYFLFIERSSRYFVLSKGVDLTKGRGNSKTPQMVVELLKKAVAEKSQYAVSKETGLGLATINAYLKGKGEPTTATLERLANYFGKSVEELRGGASKSKELIDILSANANIMLAVLKYDKITDQSIINGVLEIAHLFVSGKSKPEHLHGLMGEIKVIAQAVVDKYTPAANKESTGLSPVDKPEHVLDSRK